MTASPEDSDNHAEIIERLQASSTVDMTGKATILSENTAYRGPIFDIVEQTIQLPLQDGGLTEPFDRQLIKHSPAVVLLVHDCAKDLYLLEREYRVGISGFAFGLPAGLVDPGEDTHVAAIRELHEETGVVVDEKDLEVDLAGSFYSSEGMTDEKVTIMVLHMHKWTQRHTHFDRDENVQSTWVDWDTISTIGVTASNSVIALKHEALRRVVKPER